MSDKDFVVDTNSGRYGVTLPAYSDVPAISFKGPIDVYVHHARGHKLLASLHEGERGEFISEPVRNDQGVAIKYKGAPAVSWRRYK